MNAFKILQPFLPQVLGAIKKEIKTEHLSSSHAFYRTHFGTKPLNRLTLEEIFGAYEKELLNGSPELAEWVISRWVFKHGDLYNHFAKRLSELNPNFEEIREITEAQADYILDGAAETFGPISLYLFSILNGVVFPEAVLTRLKSAAEATASSASAVSLPKAESVEELLARHQREVAKLEEKCDQKIAGVMKKYTIDTEALKKQIRSLQQQLNACKNLTNVS